MHVVRPGIAWTHTLHGKCIVHGSWASFVAEAEDAEEDHDDVTFTDQDIGRLQGTAMAPPPQNPPLPSSLPPMMGTPILPGGPPRPLHFPGVHPQHQPPLPAPRSHDGLVQDFKDLLLETKVCTFTQSFQHALFTRHLMSSIQAPQHVSGLMCASNGVHPVQVCHGSCFLG